METTLSYLQTRGLDVLKRTLLLVDARHGIMKQDEVRTTLPSPLPPSLPPFSSHSPLQFHPTLFPCLSPRVPRPY
jgi:hypothetical protein